MALNGPITQTKFSTIKIGTIIDYDDLVAINNAITKLEGYSVNVDNCGNCNPSNCCQTQSCQSQTCQSTSCQSCQSCQGCQSIRCQSECSPRVCDCNCNC